MTDASVLYTRLYDPDIRSDDVDLSCCDEDEEEQPADPMMIPTANTHVIVCDRFAESYGAIDSADETQNDEPNGFVSAMKLWRKKNKDDFKPHQRLVDRDATYHQSFGRWNISRIIKSEGERQLFANDKFHTLVHMSTWKVLGLLFTGYLMIVLLFASVYLSISLLQGCNLKLYNFHDAYFFSLETMTTVGYGTNDIFFDECVSVMVVVTIQALTGLLIDALLIGLLFARISRPQTRATTVVFSDKAVIRRIRGEYYLMFQVGELRKHQLLETKVRCYAVRHHRTLPTDINGILDETQEPETVHFQTHSMRLQHPDDGLGASLLLVLPQVIVHRIDAWSPLMPPPRWVGSEGIVQWGIHEDCNWNEVPWDSTHSSKHAGTDSKSPSNKRNMMLRKQTAYWSTETPNPVTDSKGPGYVYRFPDLLKRWDDADGARGTWYEKMKDRLTKMEELRREREKQARSLAKSINSKCSDSYKKPYLNSAPSIMKLFHDEEDQLGEVTTGSDSSASPQSLPNSDNGALKKTKEAKIDEAKFWFAREEKKAINTFIKDREIEIIVIVEGTDLSTGSTVQCRNSYTIHDIVWDHMICPCVTKNKEGKCIVDFSKFHDIRPAPVDCVEPGFIQSYA